MNKNILINIRINEKLKNDFHDITNQEGTNMSEVIEACIEDIVKRGAIPNNLKSRIKRNTKPLLTIPKIKKCVEEVMLNYFKGKIKTILVFGSYARVEATKNSDVD